MIGVKQEKVEDVVKNNNEQKLVIEEQQEVLRNKSKNMLVSASAGSGKTHIMIEYISSLVCEKNVSVKNLLVLTFTKAAATEMKERLLKKLREKGKDEFVLQQIDELSVANICTIDAFCEKCLKKYANLVGLSAGFEILDENYLQKLSLEAFDRAVKSFYEKNEQECLLLLSNFKNDKNKIREIFVEIDTLLQSLSNRESFIEENLKNSKYYFDKATGFLFDKAKEKLLQALEVCERVNVVDFYLALKQQVDMLLQAKSLEEMFQQFQTLKYPRRPNCEQIGQSAFDGLDVAKKMIVKVQEMLQALNLGDTENIRTQRESKIEKILLTFFAVYEAEIKNIKKALNVLTFADLEFYMNKLSEKENLFSSIEYVFIDEYQDTNEIQEKIVKNIAKNCNFVAVGDAKQGIYGFRNASAEIFLKDMHEFSKNENSQVNCLKSNFRSSQKVLDFVNAVFRECMTEQTSGIDYLNSSMLEGRAKFVDEKSRAVFIDLVVEEKEVEDEALPYLYSVKQDTIKEKNKFNKKLKDVKRRIVEVMSSQISDKGVLRNCKYSDIAILTRTRDDFFDELALYLQENEVPVVSNSKNYLMDDPEMLVLFNYLKVALNMEDETALLSVLLSPLGGCNLKEISDEKSGQKIGICEIVKNNKNKKFEKFNKNIQKFRENIVFFGIKHAFLQLFEQTNYRAYINLHKHGSKLNLFIDKFLAEISASGFDNDLPSLIDYFSNVKISVSADSTMADDGVLLTTIHNSKGLEYPIVFLIGCEKDLMKDPYKKGYVEINEEFGFSVKNFDSLTNKENLTIKMQAIALREQEKKLAEELMIFYVALTRAKNRLYLFGDYKQSSLERFDVQSCKSYFDFIFFALQKEKCQFIENGIYQNENIEIVLIDEIEEMPPQEIEIFTNVVRNPEIIKRMENYLNFEYDFNQSQNFKLKESVTSLNNKNKEDLLNNFSNEKLSFVGAGTEIGNAYHLALKVVDFQNVSTMKELVVELEKHKSLLSEGIKLVDNEILLRNILLLKNIVNGEKIFKEREFVLKDKLCNILKDCPVQEEIIVQGTIDLFSFEDDGIVLVDYKYSNSNNDEYLLNSYEQQIRLYKLALEKCFDVPVKKAYLLSLKRAKLIEVN